MRDWKIRLNKLLIYFIGPGGVGKTTTAKLLAFQSGFDCYDLDEYFMKIEGDIAKFIVEHGYKKYAVRNFQLFLALRAKYHVNRITIIVCSSGFMAYPSDIDRNYIKVKDEIENHIFTFLLLPSLDLETCVKEVLTRQMNRTYLNPVIEKEELKIRARFELYSKLGCRIVLTDEKPERVAQKVKVVLETRC
ncbi:shikimate kinase [Acinetobacter sp. 3657]|uniref:shikimate kinase n=1 Tax=Acinetobacter sp. 3657 TaxID=2817764 RepID=UPI0028657846|nr:shikimate kinase [Prolinoborus sp. 3657]